MRILSLLAATALTASSFAAQQAAPKPKPKPKAKASTTSKSAKAPAQPASAVAPAPAPKPKLKPRVALETSYGPVVVELEAEAAPQTVANFLAYVRSGHYENTVFHRVIRGFMVQGGGFEENLEEKRTLPPIPNEAPRTFRAGLKNTRGTLAMARTSEPHSATSQFYINTVDNPMLDFKAETPDGIGYCAFGRVVEGMEAVDKIEKVRTVWRRGMQDVPEYAVKIKRARILPEPSAK